MPQPVLVIGGGLAGLVAAATLLELGRKVTRRRQRQRAGGHEHLVDRLDLAIPFARRIRRVRPRR